MNNGSKNYIMQERAKNRIPGMTQLLSKRPDMFSQGVWPGYYSKAKGAYVWDLDGNKFIDMSISGIGANVLGYSDPDIDAAVLNAVKNGVSSSLNCPEEVELADLLCRLHPWAEMARFTRTGGEAMAVAVRIARASTGRDKVAFCGYHGWHDWYLAANLGEENALGGHLLPGLEPIGVPKNLSGTAFPFRYNKIEDLESIITKHGKDLAAIIMEPIRNIEPEPDFIESVRGLANETGAVLIMDEISAGFRLVTGGAHLIKHKTAPDIAVFSKALGNGYSIAALIGIPDVMLAAERSFISSTNWTERIGPTAAIATIKKHEKLNVSNRLIELGNRVQEGWQKMADKNSLQISVAGIAPMGHFTFNHDDALAMKAYFIQLMLDKGFLASNLYYAMFAHTDQQVSDYLHSVDEAFSEISHAMNQGNLLRKLKGNPSTEGFKRLT